MLGEILLIIGIFEILLGISFYTNTNKKLLNFIYKSYLEDDKYENTEEKNNIKKFLGQSIALEGGMYLFLGAVSIYTNMNVFLVIALIIIIELTFFSIIRTGLRNI